MRKPHNLVTAYWDDSEYFLLLAEVAETQKETSGSPILFPNEKRGIRYSILSSFLFLEAFINAEYFNAMRLNKSPEQISVTQKKNLDKMIIETSFEDKWSKWIEDICERENLNFKSLKEFREIKKLKDWRNHLTHYKIHNLMLVAKEIETIDMAREANRIAKQSIKWYYKSTGLEVPEWVQRDIINTEK